MNPNHKSWQRLEPHSRNEDISAGIRATVYDPLWMLARQWQLGEFEGEDSGSPIFVKVENRQASISGVILNDNDDKPIDYDGGLPLETYVERTRLEVTGPATDVELKPHLDLQMQVRLGLQFQREMDLVLKDLMPDPAELRKFKRFLAQDPDLRFELSDKQNDYELEACKKFISIVKGRVINVYKATTNLDEPKILKQKALQYFVNNPSPLPDLPVQVGKKLGLALKNLKIWWDGNKTPANPSNKQESFFERPPENFPVWNPRRLEYDFKVKITPTDPSKKLILDASGYKEDHLDWYSFTVSEASANLELPPPPPPPAPDPPTSNPPPKIDPIATNLTFAGMPEKRWWNFENNYVDFGSIDPKMNNITSALLMEFALVYSPDWYVIPHTMSVGTINKIETLTVVDCFGKETIIKPAGHTDGEIGMIDKDETWDSWGMFTLSEKYKDRDEQHYTPYFFLPPTIDHVLSGPPLEEVKMIRDETANLVWAVERMYRTFYGEPVSGYDHSVLLQKKAEEALPADETEGTEEHDKPLKYTLMTSVPRNWIPFIPVHVTEGPNSTLDPLHKHIKLQRAAMIDPINSKSIHPNSRLLNEVGTPYYVEEEEVPRNGIIVSENCQRTIWHTGETFLWIARKKFYGAGEGSSGLQFDSIPLKKNQ